MEQMVKEDLQPSGRYRNRPAMRVPRAGLGGLTRELQLRVVSGLGPARRQATSVSLYAAQAAAEASAIAAD